MKARILIVDDEDSIRNLIKTRLDREGYSTVTCSSAQEAEQQFKNSSRFAVMITDLKMPGKDGFALTSWCKDEHPMTRIIVITGHGEKEAAVKTLKLGASDYLEKPFELDDLVHSVTRCVREYDLEQENDELLERLQARVNRVEGKKEDEVWYVSKDTSMAKVNEWLSILRREAMRGDAEDPGVLILGESGTGKEGIARMIHTGSRRGRGSWVAVNCANFNDELLESELFGHEKGAFTGANTAKRGLFEVAKGGTLFLDEIGEMDPKLQAKLLRVLQEKVFKRVGGTEDLPSDVRVIAATNRKLDARVREGQFREDLYHRLSKVVIELPPLRERQGDILPMAKQFAEKAFHERGKKFEGFSTTAEQSLQNYSWQGNVRELLNVVERVALVWNGHGIVDAPDLGLPAGSSPVYTSSNLVSVPNPSQDSAFEGFISLKKRWTDVFEREYLEGSLRRHNGNVSAAAREAKLDRSNFLRLLRRHAMKATPFRKAA